MQKKNQLFSLFSFFEPACESELMEQLLPKFTPHDMNLFVIHLATLCLFLPIHSAPPGQQTRPSAAFKWVPVIMSLWSSMAHVATVGSILMELLASWAEQQCLAASDFALSSEQVAFVFSVGMKQLGLPVGSGTSGLELMSSKKKKWMQSPELQIDYQRVAEVFDVSKVYCIS